MCKLNEYNMYMIRKLSNYARFEIFNFLIQHIVLLIFNQIKLNNNNNNNKT
jgi:hypothetical protein